MKIIGDTNVEITELCTESGKVRPGALFFCINGERYDSHNLSREVTEGGAVAFIAEHPVRTSACQIIVKNSRVAMAYLAGAFYGFPARRLKCIGITGTNGKTTTTFLLASILRAAGKRVGVIGTLGVFYGRHEIDPVLTTPDPVFLHRILKDMAEEGIEYVVMEVSAHAIYYHKTYGIHFEACIFTNCTQDHLDFFGTMGRYAQTKAKLFRADCAFAVLNYDDALGREIGTLPVPHISYALENPADVFAVNIEEGLLASRFVLNLADELYEIELSLTGLHNVYNAMAAAACAHRLGIALAAVAEGLSAVKKVSGRLEYVASFHGADIFVDFAHTPDGLEKSLAALKPHCKGRLICLFGCGGNRDSSKREIMGEVAGKLADFCVLTSDNPRFEDPYDIIMEIERGYRRYSKRYVTVQEREKATEYAIKFLAEGDILLVAGKGGETYQEIMGVKHDYSDPEVIKSIIGKNHAG